MSRTRRCRQRCPRRAAPAVTVYCHAHDHAATNRDDSRDRYQRNGGGSVHHHVRRGATEHQRDLRPGSRVWVEIRKFSLFWVTVLIATPQSLAKWDGDDYNLGEYAFLQPTIDQYAGSFGRYGVSVRVGLHSWSVFDPLWADKEFCLANEDLLACEIRLNNPSMMIIFLGSNDAGSPGGFDFNYRQIVDTLIEQGIVPLLATKADRFEGGDNVNNNIIRQIAVDYQLPLMEFDISWFKLA